MSSQSKRYQELGIRESLETLHQYPIACNELCFILRGIYKKVPKLLQNLIFQDLLSAFRLLPLMPTRSAVSAANNLLHSAEFVLPKHKRVLAVTEFKHAMVSHKRRCKTRHQEAAGWLQLPQDVLLHIFSFLDTQSLLSAGTVCWSWNLAASDDFLWQLQYDIFFGNSPHSLMSKGKHISGVLEEKDHKILEKRVVAKSDIDWREAFKRAYKGDSSKKIKGNRGYCGHCNAIVWLHNMKCPGECSRLNYNDHKIKPVNPKQIADYIVDGNFALAKASTSQSDSDSDEDFPLAKASTSRSDIDSNEDPFWKLWAFPRLYTHTGN